MKKVISRESKNPFSKLFLQYHGGYFDLLLHSTILWQVDREVKTDTKSKPYLLKKVKELKVAIRY
jgi:hypothetical protein